MATGTGVTVIGHIRLEWSARRGDGDVTLLLEAFDIKHESQLAKQGMAPGEQRTRAKRFSVDVGYDELAHLMVTQGQALARLAHEESVMVSDLRLGIPADATHTERFRAMASRTSGRVCRCDKPKVLLGLHDFGCFLSGPPAAPGTPEAA